MTSTTVALFIWVAIGMGFLFGWLLRGSYQILKAQDDLCTCMPQARGYRPCRVHQVKRESKGRGQS